MDVRLQSTLILLHEFDFVEYFCHAVSFQEQVHDHFSKQTARLPPFQDLCRLLSNFLESEVPLLEREMSKLLVEKSDSRIQFVLGKLVDQFDHPERVRQFGLLECLGQS